MQINKPITNNLKSFKKRTFLQKSVLHKSYKLLGEVCFQREHSAEKPIAKVVERSLESFEKAELIGRTLLKMIKKL